MNAVQINTEFVHSTARQKSSALRDEILKPLNILEKSRSRSECLELGLEYNIIITRIKAYVLLIISVLKDVSIKINLDKSYREMELKKYNQWDKDLDKAEDFTDEELDAYETMMQRLSA